MIMLGSRKLMELLDVTLDDLNMNMIAVYAIAVIMTMF